MNARRWSPCRAVMAGGALVIAGCTSVSGLDGSSSYACKAPEGVTCDSVSGTYANALQNNLPSQQPHPHVTATAAPGDGKVGQPSVPTATANSSAPMPLRSSARILRLWFKPWEDADRDLYDQGYVYVQIDSGQWLIEHAQRQIREAYAPLRPPPRGTPEAGAVNPPPNGAARMQSTEMPLPGLVPPASRPDGTE